MLLVGSAVSPLWTVSEVSLVAFDADAANLANFSIAEFIFARNGYLSQFGVSEGVTVYDDGGTGIPMRSNKEVYG